MRRYDLVIFDLDGTIADTKRDLADATNHTLAELGLPAHDVEEVASFVGGGLKLLLTRALGPHGSDPVMIERALAAFRPYYKAHMMDATRPYPGTMEMLDAITKAGLVSAIATNKPRLFTGGLVPGLFGDRFDPVIACGSSADDDAPRKPDPTCVAMCRAKHPKIPTERVIFVGDSVVDYETAKNGGLDVVSVTWGYAPREKLLAQNPRWVADDNTALQRILLG